MGVAFGWIFGFALGSRPFSWGEGACIGVAVLFIVWSTMHLLKGCFSAAFLTIEFVTVNLGDNFARSNQRRLVNTLASIEADK